MTNNCIQTILLFNSTAVAAYESGENEIAATKLIEALRLLPLVVSKSNAPYGNNQNDKCYSALSYTRISDSSAAVSKSSVGFYDVIPIEKTPCSYCDNFLYSVHPKFGCSQDTMKSRPFIDSCQHGSMYSGAFVIGSNFELKEAAAIMLYNLALVMHTEGLRRNRSLALYSALGFYRQALAYLSTIVCNSFTSPAIYVLKAAILTNLSQITNELCESTNDAIETTVDLLVQLILRMEGETSIRQEDIEFFQRSVTFVSLTNLDLAPAA